MVARRRNYKEIFEVVDAAEKVPSGGDDVGYVVKTAKDSVKLAV